MVKRFFLRTIILIWIALNSLVLVSCLSAGDSEGSSSSSLDFGFSGVSAVTAINSTTLKIQWAVATSSSVLGYRVYERAADGNMTAIAELSSSATSYNHSSLTPGTFHNYVVRAFSASAHDGNSIFKGNYTYSGVASVTITGTSTATVTFPAGGSFADAVNIYGTARGVTTLLGTTTNSATTMSVTGLKSGTTYAFSAKVSSSGITYDNLTTLSGQTTSHSSTKYKGVMLVQAYGDAPGAPSGTPQSRKTVITWNAFTGATSSTLYKLVRTGRGNTLDTTTTTACTSALTTSCQVCTASGAGAKTCNDTNIAVSPQVYDYAVVLVPTTNWPEELPSSDSAYRITVPVPPSNMVLVHRDSVNYEMCQLMGITSDALNHQRCVYTGLGGTPYSTGPDASPLSLTAGHYDFGYNLFVDRWVAACNWTKSQATGGTGMCGASNSAGDCFGTASPDNTIGVTGNVYYDTDGGSCYYRQAGSWIDMNNPSLSATERALAYTIDPSSNGGFKPPMVNIDQSKSMTTCQAVTDADYGAKRLLRQREFVAMAAWRTLTGEPNMLGTSDPLTNTQIIDIENGSGATAHTTAHYCNANSHAGITATNFTQTELSRVSSGGPDSFVIGSTGTKNCVSRYGVQDHVGNIWQWVSDQMTCSTATHTCSGTQSSVDSSNGYSSGFDMNNFQFDGIQGPGGTLAGQTGPNYTTEFYPTDLSFGVTNFSFPMGLPLVGNDGGNAKSIAANSAKFHNDRYYLYTDSGLTLRALHSGGSWGNGTNVGRWASYWDSTPTVSGIPIGFRCAVPAE